MTRRGVADVVLVERNEITSGTTWDAAGLVAQLRASHNMTRLAAYSGELYEEVEAEGLPTGFERTGSVAVASNHERHEELVRDADMARWARVAQGVDVTDIVTCNGSAVGVEWRAQGSSDEVERLEVDHVVTAAGLGSRHLAQRAA